MRKMPHRGCACILPPDRKRRRFGRADRNGGNKAMWRATRDGTVGVKERKGEGEEGWVGGRGESERYRERERGEK